ncbi:MAG: TonB family protein [Acidobacteria bacterium]|nr:TonB family protein [Acidobacteriota bacterium]
MTSLLAALTVKVSAILFLTLAGARCLRARSASARHWVLAVGVLSACAAPALHVLPMPPAVRVAPVELLAWSGGPLFEALPLRPLVPFAGPAGPGSPGAARGSEPGGFRPGRPRPAVARTAFAAGVGRWAVAIWLVGAVGSTMVLLVGLARLRWLRAASCRVTDGPWHRLCGNLARSCEVRRGVDLLLGPRPGMAATWGWRRPAVMLPAGAFEWSPERMRVVLLHELAHARRGDWLLQMAAEALRCVWWFNPLAWLVRARLRRESEQAADDMVLAQGVPATTCATQLVELAKEVRKHRRTWLPAPAMARPSHLERRLSAMLNSHTNRRPLTRFARFSSLGSIVLASVLVAGLQVAAQTARISGAVIDQAGHVVQNPALSLTNRATAEQLRVTGDDAGRFEFTDLEPSEYSLVVTKPGFERLFRRFSPEAGQQIEEELVLRLGSVEETITVTDTGESPTAARTISEATRARYLEHRNQGGTIAPPIKIRDLAPVYPASVRGSGFEGKVVLEAQIKTDGTVEVLQILAPVDPATMTTVYPDLARSAVEAVGGWRYEPTLLHGVPVETRMTINVTFRP